MKRTVRLTESELKQLVKESVITILNENVDEFSFGGVMNKAKKGFKNTFGQKDTIRDINDLKSGVSKYLEGTNYRIGTNQKYPYSVFIIDAEAQKTVGKITYSFNDDLFTYNMPGHNGEVNSSNTIEDAVNNILSNAKRLVNEKTDKGDRKRGNPNYSDDAMDKFERKAKKGMPQKKVQKRVNVDDYVDESINVNEKTNKGSRNGENANYSDNGDRKRKQPYKKVPKHVNPYDFEDDEVLRSQVRECIKSMLTDRK